MSNDDPALGLLGAVQADDRLLDNLGSAVPLIGGDRRLCLLLLASRTWAESWPIPELVDTDTAAAVIAHAAHPWRDVLRTAAAGAVVLLALVGLGLMLSPFTTWWWAVPVVGASGLAGALAAVIRMRPSPEWTTHEMTGDQRGSS
jgi:hypothetical protein